MIHSCLSDPGLSIAEFAGGNLHRRLAAEEAYHEKRYDVALKKAFLGMDEDLKNSTHSRSISLSRVVKSRTYSLE